MLPYLDDTHHQKDNIILYKVYLYYVRTHIIYVHNYRCTKSKTLQNETKEF